MLRYAEAIGTYRIDVPISRLDEHLAVAIDQAGTAIHVDLREAKLVVVDNTILRRDDLASFLIDEAVETADADGRPEPLRERADPNS